MFSADFLEPRDFQLFPHPPPVSLLAVVSLGCLLNFPLHRSLRQGQKGQKLRERSGICTRQNGRGTHRNCLGPDLLILSTILPFSPKRQPSCLLRFLLSFPAIFYSASSSVSVLRKRGGVSSLPLGTKGCIKVSYRQHVLLEHVA